MLLHRATVERVVERGRAIASGRYPSRAVNVST
jgi:hypothetical protein